ncbi:hypothetical protein SK803_02265 [Lentzea sp. BCCO 10_0856]|uniref:PknH-like extracellular domain-containing protein n=1 Tax=Lentzea miocenica TaxID=3095431 RepID=A0ABU4SSY3_9PSEU|nr:hypothetical protein [Lentzea sp. BCCO 10_0856]MDX8029012.1 hypothetical protein [Lentzea sp. BCCO 10_0856]
MRIRAAVMAAVALIAGCATAAPVTPTAPPATTSSVVPPTPAELDQRAKVALAPPGAFDALGGKADDTAALDDLPVVVEGQAIGEVCGTLPRVDKGTSAARSRSWSGGVNLFERVHVTSELPASALVSTVRQQARACASDAEVALTRPEGVDESFAYCEPNDPGAIPWSCQVALARGNVFALVAVNGQTEEAASAQLTSVLPIFAESLVKA